MIPIVRLEDQSVVAGVRTRWLLQALQGKLTFSGLNNLAVASSDKLIVFGMAQYHVTPLG